MLPSMRVAQRLVAPRSFASLAASDDISKLAAMDVAVKMITAPITGSNAMSGMGVITGVGSGVSGLKAGDTVVSKGSLGSFRAVAKASAASLVKVPSNVPAEYAAVLSSAATAALLLKGLKPGDVVVQSGACSLVGQAVVQLARTKGVVTVNVVAPSTDEEEMVSLLKSLGGDAVVPSSYPRASGGRFKALLNDLPAPALAIRFEGAMDDASLGGKALKARGSVSQLRKALSGASKADLNKLKVAQAVCAGAKATVSHGPATKDHFASASEADAAQAVAEVAPLLASGDMGLWVEKYPLEDLAYATKRAQGPMPGFRTMVAAFD